jgi:C4-dicarboxylate-specific signal transduction histidine kinase
MSTLAKKGGLDAEAVETNTSRIKTCVQRIATIVSELRDFSRDSSGDPFTSVPVSKIVSETLDLCSARFASKGVKLELGDFSPDWHVHCRASQISQVLLNLLNNAYDAVVGLATRWVRLDGREIDDAIEISVTDSGSGIDEEVVEKMMVPFFTTKPPGMGTGLGLSISSNIVTDHGGELRFDRSSENTRFSVLLPKRNGPTSAQGSSGAVTSTV